MSTSKATLQKQAAALHKKIAEAEATLEGLRAKLAKIDAQLTNSPKPEDGLDLLWKASPEKARERSSKHLCRLAWNKIPKAERPTLEAATEAMKTWCRCDEWKKDSGQFIPGVDKWITQRRWESVPKVANPMDRYEPVKKAMPASNEPPATADDLAALRAAIQRGICP